MERIQADDLRVGDVIENTHGVHITVQAIHRTDAGCLDVNPGQEGEMNGHAWEWVKVITRGPEPTPACPCLTFQRYECGHCRHTDCQNPDCGHCPCKCRCR
jgi:hypothetical protein